MGRFSGKVLKYFCHLFKYPSVTSFRFLPSLTILKWYDLRSFQTEMTMKLIGLTLMLFPVAASVINAAIYKWGDEKGTTNFMTNRLPSMHKKLRDQEDRNIR